MTKKTVWLTKNEVDKLFDSEMIILHFCPHCGYEIAYPCSNIGFFHLITSGIDLECLKCNNPYKIAFDGNY